MDFNWLSVGTALVNETTGHVMECNHAFQTLVGIGLSEDAWNVLPRGDTAASTSTTASTTSNKNSNNHNNNNIIQRGDYWLRIHRKVVGDELIFVQVSDITLEKQADERAMAFLDVSFDGFWDWHMKDDYEYMSPRFWEMFGYDASEKKHHPSEWQSIIFEQDVPAVMENLKKHISSRGKVPFRNECRYRHKNGSTVVISCNGRVIQWDDDGQPVRMLGTHTDITEIRQKQKMELEQKMNTFLSHKIRNPLTSAVQAAQFLQVDCLASGSGSGGDTSNSNNNNTTGGDSSRMQEDLRLVHDNLMSISSLIAKLVELNKMHRGTIVFHMEPTNILTNILQPVQKLGKELISNTGDAGKIQLTIACEDDMLLMAQVDGLRLKQAIFTIIEGSVGRVKKFMLDNTAPSNNDDTMVDNNDGQQPQKGTIQILAQVQNTTDLIFVVEDSGDAISEADDLLLGSATDGVLQSTSGMEGAGIYTSRALVHAMGGSLRVESPRQQQQQDASSPSAAAGAQDDSAKNRSSKNNSSSVAPQTIGAATDTTNQNAAVAVANGHQVPGLRATITLPGVLGTADAVMEGTDGKSASTSPQKDNSPPKIHDYYVNGRCLVIDDDKIITKLMRRRLAKLIPGCQVDVAASGEQGIEMAKQHPYNLVIVDHYMPGPGIPLNGAETIVQLRLLGSKAAIVGCSANDVSALHLDAGADSFIQKPAQPNPFFIKILNEAVPASNAASA